MRETYLTTAGRIRRELGDLQDVVARTLRIWERGQASAEDYYIDAAALNLHGCYAGLERVFDLIARRIDQVQPSGPHWHQELLEQMSTEIPNVRPPVLSPEVQRKLDRYRGFRHVVRNVYTMDFDPEQIELLVNRLPDTMEQVTREFHAFADVLEDIASDR